MFGVPFICGYAKLLSGWVTRCVRVYIPVYLRNLPVFESLDLGCGHRLHGSLQIEL